MVLFASDLDNTILFSHRYRQETDQCVEHLEGREQGFCTQRSLRLLETIGERGLLFVPVTTRSIQQYRRIRWPQPPRYAVTTNGGTLLVDGIPDPVWQAETAALTAPWQPALLELERRLPEVPVPKRGRIVDGTYLFAACDTPEDAAAVGAFFVGSTGLETAVSGRKVYFFPPGIHKGAALERLRARFAPTRTICAGDSVIDIPMLLAADVAILPGEELLGTGPGRRICPAGRRFPDFVLETVLEEARDL